MIKRVKIKMITNNLIGSAFKVRNKNNVRKSRKSTTEKGKNQNSITVEPTVTTILYGVRCKAL